MYAEPSDDAFMPPYMPEQLGTSPKAAKLKELEAKMKMLSKGSEMEQAIKPLAQKLEAANDALKEVLGELDGMRQELVNNNVRTMAISFESLQ